MKQSLRMTFSLYLVSMSNTRRLFSSGVVPLTSLCIEPGKAVWVLYVDATCINYDGNAFDATLLAVVSALRNGELTIYGCTSQY